MSTDANENMPPILAAAAEGSAPATTGAAHREPYPPPPSLHWGIVLLLSILTCGLFGLAWLFVQAIWVKKVHPASKALVYLGVALGLSIAAAPFTASANGSLNALGTIPNFAYAVLWLVAVFSMKYSIEEHYNVAEPLGLKLGGVKTFFFSVYYFQYHFTRIIKLKRSRGQIA